MFFIVFVNTNVQMAKSYNRKSPHKRSDLYLPLTFREAGIVFR